MNTDQGQILKIVLDMAHDDCQRAERAEAELQRVRSDLHHCFEEGTRAIIALHETQHKAEQLQKALKEILFVWHRNDNRDFIEWMCSEGFDLGTGALNAASEA